MVITDKTIFSERKASFDARTAQFLRMGFDRFAAADFVVSSVENLESPVLDIGTGRGITAMALAKLGLDVVSVDIDGEEQKFAAFLSKEAGFGNQIRFVCSDASTLSFPDEHFGSVIMMDALHHLFDSLSVLNEIVRVIKPNGTLILADFSSEGFDLVARVHKEEGREHQLVGITLEMAESILLRKGLITLSRKSGHKQEVVVFAKKLDGNKKV